MFFASQTNFDPALFVIFAALTIGITGILRLFFRNSLNGQLISVVLTVAACSIGVFASLQILFSQTFTTYLLDWGLPFEAAEFSIDRLSAFFLLPVFLVSAAGSLFSLSYWQAAAHQRSEPTLTFFYALLSSSMAVLLMAKNGILFIMIWEIMALSAYFLLVTEHYKEEVRQAGVVYLIATHTGTVALFVYFSLLAANTGSFNFPANASLTSLLPIAPALALAAFAGFGAKAGIMPFHIWLPSAHANAPSHVSALMSGVMLKMGLYGILRTITFFQAPPLLWGVILTVCGIISALFGVAFAVAQHDMKRLLAYSSIENIGIITTGIGISIIGAATQNSVLMYLGMAAALLHTLNHSLFKPLLFLGSGVVIHAFGTRNMNFMGGLGKIMPRTALIFLIGVIAICGIPPLNGFISEFFLYLAMFSPLNSESMTYLVLLAPLIAVVGGLAVIAFIKLYNSVFLGSSRNSDFRSHIEAKISMLLPITLFAVLCILIGLLPQYAMRLVAPPISSFYPHINISPISAKYEAIFSKLSVAAALLLAVIIFVALFWKWSLQKKKVSLTSTWGCGYQGANERMQYGATAFSELAVSIFDGVIKQKISRPELNGIFPVKAKSEDEPTETLIKDFITPVFASVTRIFGFLHHLQHGMMHIYMIYIFATLFVLMLWSH